MNIKFLVNEIKGGWEPDDNRLGGTEESVREWARCLVKLGHKVSVFYNPSRRESPTFAGFLDDFGVFWEPRWYYGDHGYTDVTINVKSSEYAYATKYLPGEKIFYLTNEVNASELDLSAFEGVIWPSQWAVDNIPVNNKTFILPHGYNSSQVYPRNKIPKQCFYASSPDRGLDTVLKAWPEVYRAHPDATLLLTYGSQTDLPGVICLGETDEETMNQVYRTSDVWVHPANGGELYCMTGIKAQASGCVPLYFPIMALSETVKCGVKSSPDTFARDWIELLNNQTKREKIRSELKHEHFITWDESTKMLEGIIKGGK